MRDDQKERLKDLAQSIGDAFLNSADPAMWTGAGQAPDAMDPQTRGARNWDVKNANQVGSLFARVLDLRDRLNGVPTGTVKPDDEPEHDLKKYEKQAKELLAVAGSKKKSGAA